MSKKLILGVLGTLFKMPETEVADLLKTDGSDDFDEDKALKLIVDKDKERVATLKAEGSSKWDDAVKKATKEVWSKVEKSVKENFDIESDLKGEELIEHLATLPKPSNKKGELTEDDVKKHPVFIKAEKDWKKQVADKEAEKEKALKEAQDQFTQKEIFTKAKEAALLKFKKIGEPILPADAEKASRMVQKLLVDELEGYTYQLTDGKFIILNKDGTRAEDEHGHAVEFEDLVEKIAKSNFEFKASTSRQAPGNGNNPPPPAKGEKKYTGKAPATKAEYVGLLVDESLNSEQKLEIKETYGEQFSKV